MSGFLRPKMAAFTLALVIAPAAAVFSQSPQQVEEAAARVIVRRDIQADIPRELEDYVWKLVLPDADLTAVLLWCATIAALIVVLYPLRDQLRFGRMGRAADWEGSADGAASNGAESFASVSASADELAAKGHYRDAIHLLLLRALSEMRQRLQARFADSLTSREILRSAKLPPEGSTALKDMISRVELAYFGNYPASKSDYEACRASFDRFAGALQSGAAS